jgi:hypothetical protein
MATVQSSSFSLVQRLDRHVAVLRRKPPQPSRDYLVVQELLALSRRFFGALLLLLGAAMTITLWLMPVGLPLGLLGVALLAAPSNSMRCREHF